MQNQVETAALILQVLAKLCNVEGNIKCHKKRDDLFVVSIESSKPELCGFTLQGTPFEEIKLYVSKDGINFGSQEAACSDFDLMSLNDISSLLSNRYEGFMASGVRRSTNGDAKVDTFIAGRNKALLEVAAEDLTAKIRGRNDFTS